jgi:hypothetical protein
MLNRFFVNDRQTGATGGHSRRRDFQSAEGWRFKGHAEVPFWQWVASWAWAVRRPSDMGYSNDSFALPPLNVREHIIQARKPRPGLLFDLEAMGLREELEEQRRTVQERCEMAAGLLADAAPGIAWCHRNDESATLAALIPGAVELRGDASPETKEDVLMAFTRGEIRVLVTKPSIAGHGLNWQHCHRMTYFPSHSYEQYYQAVRRCWRFGQREEVTVDLVTTGGGVATLANLQRKASKADAMFAALVVHMTAAHGIRRDDNFSKQMEVPAWLAY